MFIKKMLILALIPAYLSAMEQSDNISSEDWRIYHQIIALDKLEKQNGAIATSFVRIGNRICSRYRLPKLEATRELPDELFLGKKPPKEERS
jgi:hypothetical protein